MNFLKNKIGVTLAEMLIAVSLFATVSVVSGGILVSMVQAEKKDMVHAVIYEDLKTILQQLTYEIQHGTIDYDEYYNYYVIQNGDSPSADSNAIFYGINYGAYGSRFYNPGQSLQNTTTKNPVDLGSECSYPRPMATGEQCEIVYTLSGDTNTGQNPYHGAPESANAFCDGGQGRCTLKTGETNLHETDHLFLIDSTGTKKTIIAKKLISQNADSTNLSCPGDCAVGLVTMDGEDIDQNGVVDVFSCSEGFNCYGSGEEAAVLADSIKLPKDVLTAAQIKNITVPTKYDLSTPFLDSAGKINPAVSYFVPISPLRSAVKNLKFIINPLEDPYKAYAEPLVQSHPTVTIVLTLGLSEKATKDYPGKFRDITVQTTVAAGVIERIDSYPPVNQIKGKRENDIWDQSWIDKIGIPISQ